MKPRDENLMEFEEIKKKVKPNQEDEEEKVCPLRRPGMDPNDICEACGSWFDKGLW